MTVKTDRPKTKRKLSNISFENEGAHVALVSKDQGGAANGHDYALVLKANNFSEEFVKKMQQVRVTLELPEFLRKFFGMYYEDAEVLAKMLGYEKPESEVEYDYDDYLEQRLESFEILKSANQSMVNKGLPEFLSKLDENQYLAILKNQQLFESALEKAESTEVEKSTQVDTSIASEDKREVSTSEVKQELEKSTMDETNVQVEMVEKATLTALEKAFADQKEQLEKALETIETFKAKEKAAVEKARKEELTKAVKTEDKVEVLFKALKDATDEDFAAVIKSLTEITAAVEKSALFQEQGGSVETESIVTESPVAKAVKAKLQAGK